MRTRVDARLRLEAVRLAFRFACDDCAHFAAENDRCSLGYPAAPRRGALDTPDADAAGAYVSTCKEFDLV